MGDRTSVSKTLLLGGAIITIDNVRRIHDPGAVAIQNDIIIAVGERSVLERDYPDADRIDLSDTAILPGLIDTHGHAGHGLTKGIADGVGDEWNEIMEEIYFRSSDDEFWRAESFLSALEHLEFGVTTSLSMTGSQPRIDDPRYAIAAATGYAELGLRHIVALGPPNLPWPKHYRELTSGTTIDVDLDHAMRVVGDTYDQLNGQAHGRISVFVGPSGLVAEIVDGKATDFSLAQLQAVVEVAEAKGTNIHTHAYAGQVKAAALSYPDILTSRLSLAHCAGISLDELDIMANAGVSASHGPLTHAYALARFPVQEAVERGVNVAISTDGSSPDRSFDLLSQGRIAAQLQRAHFADTSLLPAGKILEMMTIDAARAVGMDELIGSIEIGKRADIIAVNLRSARMSPRQMIPQRVVYVGSGLDVSFVMVDGRILMHDRRYEQVDVDQILDDADRAAGEAFKRAGVERYLEQPAGMWRSARYPS